jgi:hypothetical protein
MSVAENVDSIFAAENVAFELRKPQLLAEHAGKFALVHGDEIVGVFDSEINALQEGYRRFGPVPLFIQQVLPTVPEHSAPAMTLGILAAAD